MARKIQNGEVEGKIMDNYKTEYEINDAKGNYPMIGVYFNEEHNTSHARSFTHDGKYLGFGFCMIILLNRPTVLDFMRGKVDVNIQETYVDSILIKRDTIITYKK